MKQVLLLGVFWFFLEVLRASKALDFGFLTVRQAMQPDG